jgi:hypothetical protein
MAPWSITLQAPSTVRAFNVLYALPSIHLHVVNVSPIVLRRESNPQYMCFTTLHRIDSCTFPDQPISVEPCVDSDVTVLTVRRVVPRAEVADGPIRPRFGFPVHASLASTRHGFKPLHRSLLRPVVTMAVATGIPRDLRPVCGRWRATPPRGVSRHHHPQTPPFTRRVATHHG